MHVHASSDSLTIHTCRNFSLLRSNNCAFFLLPPNNCVFSPFAAKQLNSYSEMRPGPQWEAGLSGVQGNDFPKPTEERSSPPRARRTGKYKYKYRQIQIQIQIQRKEALFREQEEQARKGQILVKSNSTTFLISFSMNI